MEVALGLQHHSKDVIRQESSPDVNLERNFVENQTLRMDLNAYHKLLISLK